MKSLRFLDRNITSGKETMFVILYDNSLGKRDWIQLGLMDHFVQENIINLCSVIVHVVGVHKMILHIILLTVVCNSNVMDLSNST